MYQKWLVAEYNTTEVLCGLAFIHQGLTHYYGELDCNTVLLNRESHIKLGLISWVGFSMTWLRIRSQYRRLCSGGKTIDRVHGKGRRSKCGVYDVRAYGSWHKPGKIEFDSIAASGEVEKWDRHQRLSNSNS